jgi:hypothetical protein
MRKQTLFITTVLFSLLGSSMSLAEESSIKEGAKKIGKETVEVARKIGEGGKEVGKKVAEAAVEVGHATRDGAKQVAKVVKEKAASNSTSSSPAHEHKSN